MTYNASDRKAVRRAEKAAEIAELNRIAFIRHIMTQPHGRTWMYNFFVSAGMFQSQFAPNNTHATAYNLGKADLAKPIWADVFQHCPTEYIQMMQEQATKEIVNGRRNGTTADDTADGTATATGTEQDTGRDDYRSVDDLNNEDRYTDSYVDDSGFVNWPKH